MLRFVSSIMKKGVARRFGGWGNMSLVLMMSALIGAVAAVSSGVFAASKP